MINELIPLCEHQIPVHHEDLPEILRLQHIDPLHLALGTEKLLFNADGQLYAVRMYIRKPHFHIFFSLSLHNICLLAVVS